MRPKQSKYLRVAIANKIHLYVYINSICLKNEKGKKRDGLFSAFPL